MKLGFKVFVFYLVVYYISQHIILSVMPLSFFRPLVMLVVFIAESLLTIVIYLYLLEEMEKRKLSKFFDESLAGAAKMGVPPENVESLREKKEQILDFLQNL